MGDSRSAIADDFDDAIELEKRIDNSTICKHVRDMWFDLEDLADTLSMTREEFKSLSELQDNLMEFVINSPRINGNPKYRHFHRSDVYDNFKEKYDRRR